LGDSRDLLPRLLKDLDGSVDVFFHDSDHSYTHMMWEFSTVSPFLSQGGLLVSDDVAGNTAFWDFAVGTGHPWLMHRSSANIGAIPW